MYEMKNTTHRDNRLGTAEEKICKLENIPTIKNETQKKIKSKKPASVSCGTISSSQVYMSLQDPPPPSLLQSGKDRKNIWRKITENFPNLIKPTDPCRFMNFGTETWRKNTLQHIINKLTKPVTKEKSLKATRERHVTWRGTKIRMKVDFWSETNSNGKKEEHCLSSTKGKNHQSRILYPVKISFKNKGKKTHFFRLQKLKEFITHRHAL